MCVLLLAGLTLVTQLGWACLGSLLCNHFFPFGINVLWRDTLRREETSFLLSLCPPLLAAAGVFLFELIITLMVAR